MPRMPPIPKLRQLYIPQFPLRGARRQHQRAEGRQPVQVMDQGEETVCVVCRDSVLSRDSVVLSKLSPKRQTKYFRE